jgi:3-hydroxymyristoyl/3-hydroxydecanoyl-(acyl carrier protein) dehydratase
VSAQEILDLAARALSQLLTQELIVEERRDLIPRPSATTLTWHRPLPVGATTLRCEAKPGPVARDDGGVSLAYTIRISEHDELLVDVHGELAFLAQRGIPAPIPANATPAPLPDLPGYPRQFQPLARTECGRLELPELDALAEGRLTDVFGPAFGQAPPGLRLPPGTARMLTCVEYIGADKGRFRLGGIIAAVQHRPAGDGSAPGVFFEGVCQILCVYALHRGLHLCMPRAARFHPLARSEVRIEPEIADAAPDRLLEYQVEVREIGLVERPHLIADAQILRGGRRVATLRGVGMEIREDSGVPVSPMPDFDGTTIVPAVPGTPLLNELHIAHTAEGDHATYLGPLAELVTARVRPRLPRGDMLMVSRALTGQGGLGTYDQGSYAVTEYDVPDDPWYCRENAGSTMPNLAWMEIPLQAVAVLGAALGITLEYPDANFSCRNLEGRARLLHAADPRGQTLRVRSELLSHTALPGALMQRYTYEVSVGAGEPCCVGETVHGFFTSDVLAQQQGLDGGRHVPPWLDRQEPPPTTLRRIELGTDPFHGRLRDPDPTTGLRLGIGRLALIQQADVVPGGGDHGAGYVLAHKSVDPDDWFFEHHFMNDPVLPGSVSVQMLIQAVQVYAIETGLAAEVTDPYFALPVGTELRWKYRGEVLRTHERIRVEVHLREVRREPDRLLILADGSVWRDDLRIYQVDGIGVEIRSAAGAPR